MKALALALALTASALVAAPIAARAADPHHHGHDAAPAKLQLDQGRKWKTDEPLRRGMASIRETVHGAPAPLHKGTAKPEAYAEVGSRIEADVGRVVKECKLPPDADAQLHLVIADVIAGADAMKAAKDAKAGRAGLVKVDGALKAYGRYFDHPGWK
jgi:Ni/Co efflux regulator RcnB